jgi:hypothetical protein
VITALVLSPEPIPVPPSLPAGVCMLNHCERFTTTEGIHRARRRAMAKVPTEWVFWLDSDDELPADAAGVLDAAIATGAPLIYTDEEIVEPGKPPRRVVRGDYSTERHAVAPMLVHHLAVMRTEAALEALRVIPVDRAPALLADWPAGRRVPAAGRVPVAQGGDGHAPGAGNTDGAGEGLGVVRSRTDGGGSWLTRCAG